ncbi:DUF255 domain-containing protein [Marinilabiliaceae bacterium JC017]|nr:DUF255 domain-containing protein [Marinilabiliaceae bacterium JC017]
MKKILIILFFVFPLTSFGQVKVNLFNGDLNKALDTASIVNKNVLLIIGTAYCSHYIHFSEEVLSDSNIISYLNSEFITMIFRADLADKKSRKEMKKYNRSWPGWPQFYVLDSNKNLIADFTYPLNVTNEEFLKIIKSYNTIEEEWRKIRKEARQGQLSYDQLLKYIKFRDINYSAFEAIQINKQISKYLKGLNSKDCCNKNNWYLYKNYIKVHELGVDDKLVAFVALHSAEFKKINGEEEVSNYLLENYQREINWRKPEKVDKMASKYPYDTIPEAIKAVELYRMKEHTQRMIKEYEK